MLTRGVLHTTSIEGYKGIRARGEILPNVNGNFRTSYPKSKHYYGYSIGAICLFDFETAREEQYGVNYFTAWDTFFWKRNPTIVLKLNRGDLAEKLIPNSKRPKLGEPGYKGSIPFIEVWYPEAIPVSAVDSYILIQRTSEHSLGAQEFSKQQTAEFDELIRRIDDRHKIEEVAVQMSAGLERGQLTFQI